MGGDYSMKTKMFVSISILILALLIINGSCVTKKRMGKDSEELYGTWINEEYKGITDVFEINVFNPDGTMKFFETEANVWEPDVEVLEGGWIPGTYFTYTIEDKWTDSDGNVWYKVEAVYGGYEENPGRFYLLMKISDSNRVLEYMVGRVDYREEIDPTKVPYTYRIYYRQ
jgi:hypothetical protein